MSKKILDWVVAVVTISMLLYVLVMLTIAYRWPHLAARVHHFVMSEFRIMSLAMLLYGVGLFLWLIKGKAPQSELWCWLPPFVFFSPFGAVTRTFVVIACALGSTISGLVCLLGYGAL